MDHWFSRSSQSTSYGVRLRRRWSPRHVWRRTIWRPQEERRSWRRSQENPPRKREPWNPSGIRQESVGRCMWCQRRVLLQERQLPEHGNSRCCRHHLRMSTTSSTYRCDAPDLAEWQKAPTSDDHKALWRDQRVQQFKAARGPTSQVGAPYDWSTRDGNRRYSCSSRLSSGNRSSSESEGKGETGTRATTKTKRHSKLTEPARAPKQPPTPPPGRGGKDHGKKVAEATRIVAVIGITLDAETDDGNHPDWALHRSRWLATRGNQCSWLNSTSLRMTFERNLGWLILIFQIRCYLRNNDLSWAEFCSGVSFWWKGGNVKSNPVVFSFACSSEILRRLRLEGWISCQYIMHELICMRIVWIIWWVASRDTDIALA